MHRKDPRFPKRKGRSGGLIWHRATADLRDIAPLPTPAPVASVDIGFASTIYGQNASGEMVKITEDHGDASRASKVAKGPWGTDAKGNKDRPGE